MGHLVAVETREQQMLVATDFDGSPVLVYRPDGSVIKEIAYSPFGRVIKDTNPNMELPLGYRGGIVAPNHRGQLLFMPEEKRFYDSEIGQWFNPDWKRLMSPLTSPFDLFQYRFENNNPIRVNSEKTDFDSSSEAWAKLYGYGLDDILGSADDVQQTLIPQHRVSPTMLPDLKLVSGLEAAVESARATLGQMSFVNHNRPAAGGQLIVLNRRFSGAPSSLGNGLLLSVLANDHPDASTGLVVARAVKNVQGSVLQNVLESLVNGSQILMDLSHVEGSRQSVYYFHKPSRDQVSRLCVYT